MMKSDISLYVQDVYMKIQGSIAEEHNNVALIAMKQGVSSSESDGVNRRLTMWTYNNVGELTETQVYNGDGITPSRSSVAN